MTVHQCPKCELRFDWKTELDDHCSHDHPDFRHEYPAVVAPPLAEPTPVHATPVAHESHLGADELVRWLVPRRRTEPHHPATRPVRTSPPGDAPANR